MGQILQVNDLHVYYGSIHAVKGVSFEVNEGEVVTLIGAERRGQVHHAEHRLGPCCIPRTASIVFEGKDLQGRPRAQDRRARAWRCVPEGRRVFLQMTRARRTWKWAAYTQPNSDH